MSQRNTVVDHLMVDLTGTVSEPKTVELSSHSVRHTIGLSIHVGYQEAIVDITTALHHAGLLTPAIAGLIKQQASEHHGH